mgnify:CR=1 FL=1
MYTGKLCKLKKSPESIVLKIETFVLFTVYKIHLLQNRVGYIIEKINKILES